MKTLIKSRLVSNVAYKHIKLFSKTEVKNLLTKVLSILGQKVFVEDKDKNIIEVLISNAKN